MKLHTAIPCSCACKTLNAHSLLVQQEHLADDTIDWSVPLTHDDIKQTMTTHSIGASHLTSYTSC